MSTSISADVLAQLSAPRASQSIHREECTQCFDNQDSPLGLDVCLHCFNGGCPVGSANQHSILHAHKTGHNVVVNIRRVRKAVPASSRDSTEPPLKKLAIREEASDQEKYDLVTEPRMIVGHQAVPIAQDDKLDDLVGAVLSSMSSAQRSQVKGWEEEITSCTHTTNLVQPEPKKLEAEGLAKCAHDGCELNSNLWLCLICGSLGCGRQQFGGGGGNGHGLIHTQETGHAVAVKLGTIEPDGSADVYCYACDDARIDPDLSKHLATFGIHVAGLRKTEKSMTELQIEQNQTFDFAMTGADGKELEPLTGPGLTGFKNLGNSCYMNSTLQSLFAFPTFQTRYLTSFLTHTPYCTNPAPATCFECQTSKIADGLLSGRYSVPRDTNFVHDDVGFSSGPDGDDSAPKKAVVFQEGIKPGMFKALVGKDHAEFSTMKQQDAGEFLLHLLDLVRRSQKANPVGEDSTKMFGYALEERLQCDSCKKVRYQKTASDMLPISVPVKEKAEVDGAMQVEGDKKDEYESVELVDCFKSLTGPAQLEYSCPSCAKKVTATKSTSFATFPEVLIINASRFTHENWVPKKCDVPLLFDHTNLTLDAFLGHGLQPGETEFPPDAPGAAPAFEFNADAMNALQGMGFPEVRCQRALLATGNADADAAMNWLFGHMEDADIDDPLPAGAGTAVAAVGGVGEPSEGQIAGITEMGFTTAQAKKALRETGGSVERAVDWLFSHPDDDGSDSAPATTASSTAAPVGSSTLPAKYRLKAFISHKGPSVHSGHYVAHVWEGEEQGWVLFNDEKVVKAEGGAQSAEELAKLAYVYFFERAE